MKKKNIIRWCKFKIWDQRGKRQVRKKVKNTSISHQTKNEQAVNKKKEEKFEWNNETIILPSLGTIVNSSCLLNSILNFNSWILNNFILPNSHSPPFDGTNYVIFSLNNFSFYFYRWKVIRCYQICFAELEQLFLISIRSFILSFIHWFIQSCFWF